MSVYAVDISFTDSELVSRRKLYMTPTDFLNRFQKLDKQFETECRNVRTDLTLTDEQKNKILAELQENYDAEKATHPTDDARYISASIMTGKTHSFRKYSSISELEKELERPYGIQKGA